VVPLSTLLANQGPMVVLATNKRTEKQKKKERKKEKPPSIEE